MELNFFEGATNVDCSYSGFTISLMKASGPKTHPVEDEIVKLYTLMEKIAVAFEVIWNFKNHSMFSGTYLSRPNKGVPHPRIRTRI